jgi:hypothetical protein
MNKVGLIVTINKLKNHFSSVQTSIVCDNMDEAYIELIKYISAHFASLEIDFPDNIDDFHNIWFKQTYVNMDVFNYKCFHNNRWVEPWSHDEIYDDILEALFIHETKTAPDFAKMYGEDITEESEENNTMTQNFTSSNKMIAEFEEKMNKIFDDSKHANNCSCENCKVTQIELNI